MLTYIIVMRMKEYKKLIVLALLFILLIISKIFITTENIGNVLISKLNEDDTKTVTVEINNKSNIFKTQCSLDNENWIESKNSKCIFDLKDGVYKVYIKNKISTDSKDFIVSINEIKAFELEVDKYYLAIDETFQIKSVIDYVGAVDLGIKYSSDDESIATVDEKGLITGKGVGTTTIHVMPTNFEEKTMEITVTDLIEPYRLDLRKPVIPCEHYTEEEAHLLDDILVSRVKHKGEGTRAALIEVLRFITLNFKYKVPYFYEHGRLETHYESQLKVDGEGRYYHKGLYLSKDKYDSIEYVYEDKQMWGCPLTNYDTTDGWIYGKKYPNGLDCSGFATWALYNAGIDVGDIGAGIGEEHDLSDVGEYHPLTWEYANYGDYKVGDYISFWGHAAFIAGKDDTNLYIAESLITGVRMRTLNYKNKNSSLYKIFTYINKLDDVFTGEGEYTDMW